MAADVEVDRVQRPTFIRPGKLDPRQREHQLPRGLPLMPLDRAEQSGVADHHPGQRRRVHGRVLTFPDLHSAAHDGDPVRELHHLGQLVADVNNAYTASRRTASASRRNASPDSPVDDVGSSRITIRPPQRVRSGSRAAAARPSTATARPGSDRSVVPNRALRSVITSAAPRRSSTNRAPDGRAGGSRSS